MSGHRCYEYSNIRSSQAVDKAPLGFYLLRTFKVWIKRGESLDGEQEDSRLLERQSCLNEREAFPV